MSMGQALSEGAVVHFRPLRKQLRQVGAVRYDHEDVVLLTMEVEQEFTDRLGVLAVEIPGRLVGQQKYGLEHKRPGDGDALTFAAR